MIQLFLDGMPAIPAANANIKLTSENPLFTKAASYTYDVELPLDIPENRRIFGFLHRLDSPKKERTLTARLLADNVPVLAGTAHITSVTETAVKVQLLGAASAYNYGNKMEETYIDELDLGDWYSASFPDEVPPPRERLYTTEDLFARLNRVGNYTDPTGKEAIENLFYRDFLPWVAFPVLNETAGAVCNYYYYRYPGGTWTELPQLRLLADRFEIMGLDIGSNGAILAVQPFVWFVCQKIAEATGLYLPPEQNALRSNTFFRDIFIVNANNSGFCNRALPHWTVNEWWEQIEKTFGVVMTIDYLSETMSLTLRADHYSRLAETVCVADVVDEYTVNLDDDTREDISASNTGFADFEGPNTERLPESVRKNALRDNSFADLAALHAWAASLGADGMEEHKGTIFECADGRCYIYSSKDKRLEEVDAYRPRIVREANSDIEIEIKFVPACYRDFHCAITQGESGEQPYAPGATHTVGFLDTKVLSVPNVAEMWNLRVAEQDGYDTALDIEKVLDGEQDEPTETSDDSTGGVVYIALAAAIEDNPAVSLPVTLHGDHRVTHQFRYPKALLRTFSYAPLDGQPATEDAPAGTGRKPSTLSLVPRAGEQTLAAATVEGNAVKINATVRHCFKFVSDRVPDPASLFLIRNRRFVCDKIEATITPNGLQPLLTGYFYELDA